MLKRLSCKEDDVIIIKINGHAYTLAQMRRNGIMQFFDIVRPVSEWSGVDLNDVPSLFFIFVAERGLGPIVVDKVPSSVVGRSKCPVPKTMLSAVIGNAGEYGADLVELTDDFSSYGARIIKSGLNVAEDRDLIYRFELAGVQGDPEKIRKRLERYFEHGINWDSSKEFIFKDIPPPPPHYYGRG